MEQRTRIKMLMHWLADSHVLTSCSAAFGAFDESVMFHDEFHNITTLKRNFKEVFQVGVRARVGLGCAGGSEKPPSHPLRSRGRGARGFSQPRVHPHKLARAYAARLRPATHPPPPAPTPPPHTRLGAAPRVPMHR